jgi:protein-tyrosine phosphatase
MKKQGVRRIICLLSEDELGNYPTLTGGLLGAYAESFGPDNVLWAPTTDKRLLKEEVVKHICHFMHAAVLQGEKVVVHCSAGIGRTGQALAAWLVYYHNLTERKAIRAVEELNRSPMEAVFYRTASEAELLKVLGTAREMDKLA